MLLAVVGVEAMGTVLAVQPRIAWQTGAASRSVVAPTASHSTAVAWLSCKREREAERGCVEGTGIGSQPYYRRLNIHTHIYNYVCRCLVTWLVRS